MVCLRKILFSLFLILIQVCSASGNDKVRLQLRWDHQFQFAGYYAAQMQGYYAAEGLDVEVLSAITENQSILHATAEVAQSRADFGIGAADILLANDRGAGLAVVATFFQQSAAEFHSLKGSGIHSPAEIVGKKVARKEGDLIDVEFQALLRAEGISLKSFRSITHTPGLPFIRDDAPDLIPGYSIAAPFVYRAAGYEVDTLRPSDYGIKFYGDSLFTSRNFLEEHPEVVERFVRASVAGWKYALQNPDAVIEHILEAYPRNAPLDEVDLKEFNRFQAGEVARLMYHPVIEPGHTNPDRWRRMHEYLEGIGLVQGEYDPSSVAQLGLQSMQRTQERVRVLSILFAGVLLVALGTAVWSFILRRMVQHKTEALRDALSAAEIARDEADRANISKGLFLANMSHEIRTPLNGMLGMLDLALDSRLDQEQRELLQHAHDSGDILCRLIQDILDFSSIEARRLVLVREPFTLRSVVDQAIQFISLTKRSEKVVFLYSAPERIDLELIGDEVRLGQVLSNLLNNAFKFTAEGSVKLEIAMSPDPAEVTTEVIRLSVTDTGCGIPEEKREQIFHPFEQIDGTLTRRFGGVGLGLSIVREIVIRMGGNIALENQAPRGTRAVVELRLPHASRKVSLEAPEKPVSKGAE